MNCETCRTWRNAFRPEKQDIYGSRWLLWSGLPKYWRIGQCDECNLTLLNVPNEESRQATKWWATLIVGHHKIEPLKVAMTMVRWCLTPTHVSCSILISKSMEASIAVPNPMAAMNVLFHTKAQCTDRVLIGGWQWRQSKNSTRGAALISTTPLSRFGTKPRP